MAQNPHQKFLLKIEIEQRKLKKLRTIRDQKITLIRKQYRQKAQPIMDKIVEFRRQKGLLQPQFTSGYGVPVDVTQKKGKAFRKYRGTDKDNLDGAAFGNANRWFVLPRLQYALQY